jgi:RNA polymerase sigma-70 factor (ECF subfamily)
MSSPPAAEAFDELYRAELGRLVGALRLMAGDQHMAEEIAQETFIRAWVRWRRVRDLERPAGWLYTTAFRLQRRQQARRQAAPDADRATPGHASGVTDRVALERALAVLPVRQRQAVVARHVLGLSSTEAGEVLGLRPDAFRALLHRGMDAMRSSVQLIEEVG